MKKYILTMLFLGLMLVLPTSCLKEYLDKAPESGLTEQEVFSKYENYYQFWRAVYEGRKYFSGGWYEYNYKCGIPMYFDMWDQKYTWEGLTDCSDGGRYMEGHTLRAGAVIGFVNKFTYDGKRRPILESMFTIIRISNKCLENFHMLEQTEDDTLLLNDLKGQAYFIRAFAHFELFRIWGPMPYITEVLDEGDQFDLARLSKVETCQKIAADFDTAAMWLYRADKARRDKTGALNDAWQQYPSGIAAKAYKARALLYAASPLNNETNDPALWLDAAQANWDAIQAALNPGTGITPYALLTFANRKTLYYGANYTNETLWGYTWGSQSYNWGNFQGMINGIFGNSTSSWSGVCPTQNWVDKYETKWGEPLNTPADRAYAATQQTGGVYHYVEQNPYVNRDPRLAADIIFNQATGMTGWTASKAQIYYTVQPDGSVLYSELLDRKYLGRSFTGYYERKRWPGFSIKNTSTKYIICTPMMRLTELYLNYAEALNEVNGPNDATGITGGTPITSLAAINLIRRRANNNVAWDVLPAYTVDKAAFRPRIRNERNIELSFEGHYYFDLRRWKDAPLAYSSTIMGVDIEKVPVSTTYPTGFKYTRLPLAKDRQTAWKDAMYYLPFNVEDMYKMKNFVPNVAW